MIIYIFGLNFIKKTKINFIQPLNHHTTLPFNHPPCHHRHSIQPLFSPNHSHCECPNILKRFRIGLGSRTFNFSRKPLNVSRTIVHDTCQPVQDPQFWVWGSTHWHTFILGPTLYDSVGNQWRLKPFSNNRI